MGGRGARRRLKPVDDLASARETQLLARQPFERPIVRPQAVDARAQLVVLVQEQRDAASDLVLLGGERPQVEHAAAPEDDRDDETDRHGTGDGEQHPIA
jgi:hypothetical protein